MMGRWVVRVGLAACLLLPLAGCSVLIAANAPGVDPNGLEWGSTRKDVEAVLGQPIASVRDFDGTLVTTYEFRGKHQTSDTGGLSGLFTNPVSSNIVMDILTLGAWEIVGTPNESILEASRRTRQVTITYDSEDRLIRMIMPPASWKERPDPAGSPP